MEHSSKSKKKTTGFFSGNGRQYRFTLIIFLVIVVFGIFKSLDGQNSYVMAQVDDNKLGVGGSTGTSLFIQLEDITQVQLVDELDFGSLIEGEETENNMSGVYENDAFGTYTLQVYTAVTPYIVVTYGDGETLVFNQSSEKLTQEIYEDLTES